MTKRFLSREAALHALELAKSSYRPKEIVELKEEIDAETRVAELNASVTGNIDLARVLKIVKMKLRLDALYADWAEGKIRQE